MLVQNKLIFLFLVLELLSLKLNAQQSVLKSEEANRYYTLNAEEALNAHTAFTFNNFDYIYGKEYKVGYMLGYKTPYLNNGVGKGNIYSKRDTYKDIMLLYDVKNECLVSLTEKFGISAQYIQLNDAAIDSFDIHFDDFEYRFKYIMVKEKGADNLKGGFYEVPYEGDLQLCVKYLVKVYIKDGVENFRFEKAYYLNLNGDYYPITKQNQLFNLFSDYKKLLRKRIKVYRAYYPELSTLHMVDLVRYIESLMNN